MCYLGAPDVKTILLEDILATVSAKTALISYYVAVGSSCCGNYPTGGYSGYCIIKNCSCKNWYRGNGVQGKEIEPVHFK